MYIKVMNVVKKKTEKKMFTYPHTHTRAHTHTPTCMHTHKHYTDCWGEGQRRARCCYYYLAFMFICPSFGTGIFGAFLLATFADLQMVNISLRVLSRPMSAQLPTIYRTLGTDFDERVLPSIVNEVCCPVSCLYRCVCV